MLVRRTLITSLLAGAILPLQAMAQSWPTKTLTIVVPYAPGGATDVIARLIASKLPARLGQEVIVDNKAGAGGLIGLNAVANASPDGHTMLVMDSSFAAIAALSPERRAAARDVTPVSVLATASYVISTSVNFPAKTVQELIAQAQSRPGKINYSSGGQASSTHFAGEWFKNVANVDLQHIPYRGGSAALQSMLAGETDVSFLTVPTLQQQIKAGKLRGLAVTGERRSPSLPDVPTTREAGLPKMVGTNWNTMFVPSKTPSAVVARLNREVAAILQMPDVRAKFAELSLDAAPQSPEQSAAVVEEEIVRWGTLAKAANIKAE